MPHPTHTKTQRVLSYGDGAARLLERPVPALDGADSVVVELEVAGLCRTDQYVAAGRLPAREGVVLGHEASGRVVEAGPDAEVRTGTRVAFDPRIPCGRCLTCSREGPSPGRCLRPERLGVERDGVFAEFVAVPSANAIAIGPDVSPLRAAYLEPVAAALGALSPATRGQDGAIVGEGRIAELTARLFVQDGRPRPRVITPAELAASGEMYSLLVDAGLPDDDSLFAMTRALLPGGTLVLKSRAVEPRRFIPAEWVSRDLQVSAVAYGSFKRAAEILRDERLALQDFMGPVRPLDDFAEAFRAAEGNETVKQFFTLGID